MGDVKAGWDVSVNVDVDGDEYMVTGQYGTVH